MNGFELLGRERKARKMSDAIFAEDISSEVVKNFTDEQWLMASYVAENKPCKGSDLQPCVDCREKTLEFLRDREKIAKRRNGTT